MNDLSVLLAQAGFQQRNGADPAAIERLATALGVELPDELSAFWVLSDGATGDGIDLLPVCEAEDYASVFGGGAGYVPFTECNDSNPYAVCANGPLHGMVVHVFHDDQAMLICRSLRRFLELVSEARTADEDVDRLPGDFAFERPARTAEDAETARALAREAMQQDDEWRGEMLRFAAQLCGPGQEQELADLLAAGDEHTRRAVRSRWAGLGTSAGQDLLRADNTTYGTFLTDFRRALENAGLRTEPTRDGEFRIQPGNIGPNFPMLFADCRRPDGMTEWVTRFQSRATGS